MTTNKKTTRHLIVMRGTKELDEAFIAMSKMLGLTKAETLLELLRFYKETQLEDKEEEILREIKKQREELGSMLEKAQSQSTKKAQGNDCGGSMVA